MAAEAASHSRIAFLNVDTTNGADAATLLPPPTASCNSLGVLGAGERNADLDMDAGGLPQRALLQPCPCRRTPSACGALLCAVGTGAACWRMQAAMGAVGSTRAKDGSRTASLCSTRLKASQPRASLE